MGIGTSRAFIRAVQKIKITATVIKITRITMDLDGEVYFPSISNVQVRKTAGLRTATTVPENVNYLRF